nr:hypothetical protein GCM10020093_107250 [Planobispora longispora]
MWVLSASPRLRDDRPRDPRDRKEDTPMRTITTPRARRRSSSRAAVLLAALSATGLLSGPALAAGTAQGGSPVRRRPRPPRRG